MNLSTVTAGLIVLAVLAFAAGNLIRRRKKAGGGCSRGGDCTSCRGCGR